MASTGRRVDEGKLCAMAVHHSVRAPVSSIQAEPARPPGEYGERAATKAFSRKSLKSQQRSPQTITLDGYAASQRAVREMNVDGSLPTKTRLRSSRYLNTFR
jgi:hypothetical protein